MIDKHGLQRELEWQVAGIAVNVLRGLGCAESDPDSNDRLPARFTEVRLTAESGLLQVLPNLRDCLVRPREVAPEVEQIDDLQLLRVRLGLRQELRLAVLCHATGSGS